MMLHQIILTTTESLAQELSENKIKRKNQQQKNRRCLIWTCYRGLLHDRNGAAEREMWGTIAL